MTENTQVMSLRDCFKAIVSNAHAKALNYAVNYAKHGIELLDKRPLLGEHSENLTALRVQCLYVLNNMTHWRGETATTVRVNLRRHVRDLEAEGDEDNRLMPSDPASPLEFRSDED
jgi:hypothetical protein